MLAVRFLVVIFVSCTSWLSSSYGRTTANEEQDSDEKWPVLCPPQTFYSIQQELCLTCSSCPMNKIITSPCHGLHDTQCGPFYDFQGVFAADNSHLDIDHISDNQNYYNEWRKNKKVDSNDSEKQFDDLKSRINQEKSEDENSILFPNSPENVEFSDSEWKSLTIALIVLVSILFIVVIICVVYFLRRRILVEKKINCEYSSPPEHV